MVTWFKLDELKGGPLFSAARDAEESISPGGASSALRVSRRMGAPSSY